MNALFPGFEAVDTDVAGVRIHARVGGAGPPVLLLHGYPQTHAMWHRIAPALAREHTVVAADLRGYGDSGAPEGPDALYSKRAMAADQLGLMRSLGFTRFAAVGHDRGARVVHRLALDEPDVLTAAAVLDIVPTSYVYAHVTRELAEAYWHWFFLSRPGGLPERLIGAGAADFLRTQVAAWSRSSDLDSTFSPHAMAEYVRCFDAATIAATCADYRAGASLDLEHAAADGARRVICPLLVLWGADGFVGTAYDPLAVWREFADDVRGTGVPGGHFVAEEQPERTADLLIEFLRADR